MSLDKIKLPRMEWIDDSGSGLDGTIINNTQLQKILDSVDEAIGQSVKVVNANYTALPTDDLIKITGGSFPLYVYSASGDGHDGRQLDIINNGTGTVAVTAPAGQTIAGYAIWQLPPRTSLRIKSDGANWIIATLSPNSVFRQELTLLAGAFRPWPGNAASGPHEDINVLGYFTLGIPFAKAGAQYAYTQFTLPKAWRKDAQITMQVYFTVPNSEPKGTVGQGVYWGCGLAGMGHGESLGQSASTGGAVQGITTADGALSITGEAVIPVPANGWANTNDLIRFYIYRDTNSELDSKNATSYLLAVKLRLWMDAPHDE